MPGKMTVLDRLISEGRIKKAPFSVKKTSGEIRDPLNYPLNMRKDFDKLRDAANVQWVKMTPERQVYQKGIDAQYGKKLNKFDEDLSDANYKLERLTEQYEDDFGEAQEALAEDMSDWARNQLSYEYTDPSEVADVVRYEMPKYDLSDYWEGEYSLPEYQEKFDDFNEAKNAAEEAFDDWRRYGRQQLQTQSPRYRNYQRAMQQRAANMAMGRDLSRRYAIAYNNLLRRGLTPAEARMYMREYFGGR